MFCFVPVWTDLEYVTFIIEFINYCIELDKCFLGKIFELQKTLENSHLVLNLNYEGQLKNSFFLLLF